MAKSEPMTVGQRLSKARLGKKWSLEQASHATRLRIDVIQRIEQDEFDKLPSRAYAKGFVRIYSRELGLDEFEILRQLEGVMEEETEVTELRPEALEALPARAHTPRFTTQGMGLLVVLVTLIVALSVGALQVYRIWPAVFGDGKTVAEATVAIPADDQLKPPSLEKGEIPKAEVVAPATEQAASGDEAAVEPEKQNSDEPLRAEPVDPNLHRLQLLADKDCWVKVAAIENGKSTTIFSDIIPAGQIVPSTVDEAWMARQFKVTIRYANLVNIVFDGQNHGKFPGEGLVTFRIPRD